MPRILITGAAGLVGSHAAIHYANKGWDVVAFDNLMRSELFKYDKESVEHNWNILFDYKNIQRVRDDVRNSSVMLVLMKASFDVVIHTAGQPGVPSSMENPIEDFNINAFGTLNVLEYMRSLCPGAKFVYCSTNKVYGENVDSFALRELPTRYEYSDIAGIDERLRIDHTGHTPYGVSKYIGDIYTQEYARLYGLKTAVFRMSCTYGTRQFGFEDQGWVSHFIISNLIGKPVTIFGDGKQVRDLLYVDDLVNAFDMFIESDIPHGVYNIGGGVDNSISLIEFIHLIEKKTGVKFKNIEYKDWRPSDQKVYVSDTTNARKSLNWSPKIKIEDGIDRIVKWVKENKDFFI